MILPVSWGQRSSQATASSVLLEQGANLAQSGRIAEAEVPLLHAAEVVPENLAVITELAKVEGRLGKKTQAIELFRRAVAMEPSDPNLRLDLALALADNDQSDEALVEISTALKLNPKLANGFLIRGQILFDSKRLDDAAKDFTQATLLNPNLAKAWYYWAALEMQRNNYARASELLQHDVSIEPQNTTALRLLGKCLFYQSRRAAAIDIWRRVLAIDPDDSQATYLLSQALRQSDPAESNHLLEQFRRMQDKQDELEQVKSLGNQGYQAMERQDWTAAMGLFEQAITKCGQCAIRGDLEKNLGLAACHSGDLRTGQRALTEALTLKPTDADIVVALRWIEQHRTEPIH